MSKMNGPTRKRFYLEMVEDEGEYCKKCGVSGKERQLVIDHKDNDNSNNRRENRQFLCRHCNYLKNPRPVDECVNDCEESTPSEIQIKTTKEPLFRRFIYHELNEYGTVPEYDLINSGAEHADISPVTSKRYLNKMCSSVGLLIRKKVVQTITIQYKDECPLT